MKLTALVGAAVVAATLTGPAHAVSLLLSPSEEEAAMRVGQRSVTSETFGGEWRVLNAAGESVSVITPFHRLALAARHAAFKNEPLKPGDKDRMLEELKDRIMLWVYLHGRDEHFARYLRPRLVMGDLEIEPLVVQNERTAVRQEDGRYLARCVYWFPTKDLVAASRPVLVIRDPDEQLVARFSIDLGKMR